MGEYNGEERRHSPSAEATLARLEERFVRVDERTERMDRDIRQMMSGQIAQTERLERLVGELRSEAQREVERVRLVAEQADKKARAAQTDASEALSISTRLDSWFVWGLRIVMGTVIAAILVAAGIGIS